jgi:hypothetical protein
MAERHLTYALEVVDRGFASRRRLEEFGGDVRPGAGFVLGNVFADTVEDGAQQRGRFDIEHWRAPPCGEKENVLGARRVPEFTHINPAEKFNPATAYGPAMKVRQNLRPPTPRIEPERCTHKLTWNGASLHAVGGRSRQLE